MKQQDCIVTEKALAQFVLGETVYGIVRHVSASGMSRVIDFYVMRDNKPCRISHIIRDLCHLRFHKHYDGLVVHGCGMDMVFDTVYSLGRALYPRGFPRSYTAQDGSKVYEANGGYAFESEAL
jgi:hypothetical protein